MSKNSKQKIRKGFVLISVIVREDQKEALKKTGNRSHFIRELIDEKFSTGQKN